MEGWFDSTRFDSIRFDSIRFDSFDSRAQVESRIAYLLWATKFLSCEGNGPPCVMLKEDGGAARV